MEVIRLPSHLDIVSQEKYESVVAIGNFDGVHLGHRALLKTLNMLAREFGGHNKPLKVGIYTLFPHPYEVFNPKKNHSYLTPLEEKLGLLEKSGVEKVWIQLFDNNFADVQAETFIKKVLHELLHVRCLVVGRNFCFGRSRRGNVYALLNKGKEFGYQVHVPSMVCHEGRQISSSWIKTLLCEGDVEKARELLGRPYSLQGIVERGAMRGVSLGFPTANIHLPEKKYWPKKGVYAVIVRINGLYYKAVANLGTKPTFLDDRLSLEAHILDFSGNLYGKEIELCFMFFLREQRFFLAPNDLVAQIKKDVSKARDMLASYIIAY